MAKFAFAGGAVVLTIALTMVRSGPVGAAEGHDNPVLKKHGLKIAGPLIVLEAESDVKNKVSELRHISKQLKYSLMLQTGTVSAEDYQKTINGLTSEISQLRSQINLANQQMNQIPRFRGRITNNFAQEQYNELLLYRNQLQMAVNQETAWLNQLKSQPFDTSSKDRIDADVRDQREAYHQALQDLRKLVDSAAEKYEQLAKNTEIKAAAAALGKGKREKLKLGPSHEFLNNVKLLEKLEKAEAAGDTDETEAKPPRRSKSPARSRRSAKAAAAAAAKADAANQP
jgi:hypothetical protein